MVSFEEGFIAAINKDLSINKNQKEKLIRNAKLYIKILKLVILFDVVLIALGLSANLVGSNINDYILILLIIVTFPAIIFITILSIVSGLWRYLDYTSGV